MTVWEFFASFSNQAEYEAWCEEQLQIAESNLTAYDWPEWDE